MDYKGFKRLYDGDRIVFMLGMELFLENGRNAVMEREAELLQSVRKQMSNLFIPEKASEVVKAAQAFSQLKTPALLTYASRCDIHLEGDETDISGVCPVCCGPLIYDESTDSSNDSALVLNWTCQDCDATGTENYRRVFDGHRNVRLGDGRLVPPREK